MSELPADICEVLEKSFKEKIKNFEIILHDGNKQGVGFLGDMLFVSLTHKTSGDVYHLVIKQVLPCNEKDTVEFMSSSYFNEIQFYSKILPSMLEFQKTFPKAEVVDIVAKYYGSVTEKGKEKLILENLKFKNYMLHPKCVPLHERQIRFLFKNYAKYHALAFAFAKYNPQKMAELGGPLKNNWIELNVNGLMETLVTQFCTRIKKLLERHDEKVILKKFQIYLDNGYGLYEKYCQYDGPYKIINHGDCWSNNMMFKYNYEGDPVDVKLLDFQITSISSPIHDLLYSFYSGANNDCLTKWELLLSFYHQNLGHYLSQYNLDVTTIYPYEEMIKEWRKYVPFGFLISGLVWQTKYGKDHFYIDVSGAMDNPNDQNFNLDVVENKFDPHMLNIMNHLDQNNFL